MSDKHDEAIKRSALAARLKLDLGGTRTFDEFVEEVRAMLSAAASSKGYGTGPDDPNPVYEMTGAEHALGEIVYKALRYRRKQDPTDLIKAAAWAFLVWRHK